MSYLSEGRPGKLQITLFSFLTSVLIGNIIAVCIYACSRRKFFIRRFGTSGLAAAYILCIIRMMLPLKLLFTKKMPMQGVINVIYTGMENERIETVGSSVSEIMLYIWIITALLSVIIFVCRYHSAMRRIMSCPQHDNRKYMETLDRIVKRSGKRIKVKICCVRNADVPMGIGISRRMIILPEGDYTEKELYYILLHEYTHFINRDLAIRMFVNIFCRVFWWNPAAYLIRKDMERILEIRCDSCVTESMGNKEKKEYLAVIVSALEGFRKKSIVIGASRLISKSQKNDMVERFRIIAGGRKTKKRGRAAAMINLMMFLAVFALSYSFVFQTDFKVPVDEIEAEPGEYGIQPDNAYIIENASGEYRIVMPSGMEQLIDRETAHELKKQGIEVKKGK